MFIGVDPHPGHHTAAALEPTGRLVEARTFPNDPGGQADFLAWLDPWIDVKVAVDGPTQPFFAPWTARLLAEGYPIFSVATNKVAARRRRKARGKTDSQDAVIVAQVLIAEPDLPSLAQPDWVRPLQELTRTRKPLVDVLKGQKMRLQTVRDPMVRQALQAVIDTLQAQVKALSEEIDRRVKELAPTLLCLAGVGTVVAATLLAEVGNIARFHTQDRFAAYCGAAPQPWQSGASHRVRVNPRGNRRLNWALHIVARTRLRIDPSTQAFIARKEHQGKTHREALRILKTYIARQLYRLLTTLQLSH